VNHQCNEDKAQNVHKKKKLDVTLVYGERDFEDTKTGMFICGFLKEDHQCNKDKVQNVDAFITGLITTGGCQGRA
jgi:hypothetical protein